MGDGSVLFATRQDMHAGTCQPILVGSVVFLATPKKRQTPL
jgi:hypothetical protein